jgi:lysozyme
MLIKIRHIIIALIIIINLVIIIKIQKNQSTKNVFAPYIITQHPLLKLAMDFTKPFEGIKHEIYTVQGIEHIGIGLNLTAPNADMLLRIAGSSLDSVKGGEQLREDQIYLIYENSMTEAIEMAQSYLPTLNEHPTDVQLIIIDMSFNMGTRIKQFRKLKEALEQHNYQRASKEMVDSKWYNQVGNRAKSLTQLMRDQTWKNPAQTVNVP